ncbi:extracellular solute-binding protein [Paenibacillus sanguinis]|uniref:ABC transporter substrate-binding protein n=1 Tax=Paenibacillus sanguinis TaxID=225906 RepID=UPI0003723657|nr:extracellular solute-binding protein [Paenibacillus sanguinis]
MNRRKWAGWLLTCMLLVTVIAGCSGSNPPAATSGGEENTESKGNGEKVALKMAMWDSNNDFITFVTEKVKEYSSVNPNVSVEVESFKSDSDYLQAIKVRAGGGALPDVMELKPNWLADFKDQLIPLDDVGVVATNKYAKTYAIDGKVMAIPSVSFPELVYYHPSIFEELKLEVPTTWPQFLEVLTAIKEDGTYIPYAMGGKDAWPDYPFNEFLPHILSDNENYLSDLAKEDTPFGEGTPFYQAYQQIAEMYNAGVMGPDPLGVGADQANDLFISKQAAIMASGLWFVPTYQGKAGNLDDLAAFPMPYRPNEDSPLKLMMFTDHFYGISSTSKHPEEAKAFMEWFYSPEVYKEYLNAAQLDSAFEGVESEVPFLKSFYAEHQYENFIYIPGDAAYTELSNAIQLDVKALGQEMMAGKSVDDIAKDLNAKWTEARKNK